MSPGVVPKKPKKKLPSGISLPPELLERLAEIAKETGQSRNEVMRLLIEAGLKIHDQLDKKT